MMKIINKIKFSKNQNRMKKVGDVQEAVNYFDSKKNKNLYFLIKNRYEWMNKFIKENEKGIEVGSGAGFSKDFIKNKNFKLTDLGNDSFLDFKNIDAQNTGFEDKSLDFVIASNMIHHIPYPIKFFKEMNRILKKNGRLIIFESYCSVFFQLATIIMKHEGFDFTLNVWDENNPKSDEENAWHGNIAVPHLIFDDKKIFNKKLGNLFEINYEKLTECLIFINSGGVTSKTACIPMNNFFLKLLNNVDKLLIKFFPNIFCMGRRIVLIKNN